MGKYGRGYIGKTFNDGKLVVLDGGDKPDFVKTKCAICSKDSELFGDGIFKTRATHLNRGRVPCGCSNRVCWTLAQYEIRIKRKIKDEDLPIKFVKFVEVTKQQNKTLIRLLCNNTNKEYELTINGFLGGKGNYGTTISVSEKIDNYNLNNPNRTVWVSSRKHGSNASCGFYCKICEAAGFECLFEISSSHLFSGKIPCYCSMKSRISGDHVVAVSRIKLHDQGLQGISVFGAYKRGGYWFSTFLCETHGLYSRCYNSLDIVGAACPKCNPSRTGYNKTKSGLLYLLEIQTNSEVVLGYGITNKIEQRIGQHNLTFKRCGYTITNIQVFEGSGTAVLAVENAIKALHPTGLLDCEGFRRESISIDRKEEVLELCKKLKELDNMKDVI